MSSEELLPQKNEKKERPPAKPAALTLLEWLDKKEQAEGAPISDKLKQFMRQKAIGRTDYDTVWEELWR